MSHLLTFSGYRNRKRLVRDAIQWFIDKRNLSRFAFWININDHRIWGEGMDGACTTTSPPSMPREFEIELENRLDEKQYLITLFHELMHVDQRLRNRHQQRFMPKFTNKWLGEIISDDTPYDQQPWEVESFAMQEKLYEEYMSCRGE